MSFLKITAGLCMVKEPHRPSDAEKLWEVHQIARNTKELCQRLSKLFSCRGNVGCRATLKHLQQTGGNGIGMHWTLYLSFLATTQPCLPTLKLAIIADVRIEGQENEGQLGQITHEEAS